MEENVCSPEALFDLEHFAHAALFEGVRMAWEVLGRLSLFFQDGFESGNEATLLGAPWIGTKVRLGPGTVVEPGACILGPAWIGSDCRIRHGAYLRENVITGDRCVLGNSCEFKNCLLLDDVQVPHFSYVGDSVLGNRAHLGAGVICSNLRLDQAEVRVNGMPTGLKKFGALVGDGAEVGCNAVLNPGTVLGRKSVVYPGKMWVGVLEPGGRGR